jgi:putative spermidine/putrescine transport system ATP-binding protein
LSDVSLDVAAGEFVTLLGPSGSGKTTLLMSVAGFSEPDAGSIRIDDREILGVPPHRRNMGMVFQSYALFPHMTVGENVAYPLKLRGVARAEREQRARNVLTTVKMEEYSGRRIEQLSGGQRQRVAVARAIVFDPDVILMDEPLSALDKKLREELQIELKHLHRRLGRTILYVTHDQSEALTLSDQIAVLNAGRIEQVAPPRTLYERPTTPFVATFVGSSTLVPLARVEAAAVDLACFGSLAQGAMLVVRPEKLQIAGNEREAGHFYFTATVRDVVYQGNIIVVYAELADGTAIRLQRETRSEVLRGIPDAGQPIQLALHRDDACIVSAGHGDA